MTEEEFRRRLDALGAQYQEAIRDMNASPDQFLKNKCRDRGYAVMAEISALEKLYRAQGKALLIVADPVIEPQPVDPDPTNPWIAYHDQLIKEWFDGEKALIDDLYPDVPVKAMSHVRDSLVSFAIALPVTAVLVLLVWTAKMLFGF